MIKGSNYQMALKESMDDMKLQALRVREEASICLQTRIAEMDRKSDVREKKAELRSKQGKSICVQVHTFPTHLPNCATQTATILTAVPVHVLASPILQQLRRLP
jgi:hypothetical protein